MLERASTCLESRGRQLLQGPKKCLRSRRMLHSAFWHHGANHLYLPMWWAASSLLDGGVGDLQYRLPTSTTSVAARPSEGALLDFLYPEKALALLKRLSVSTSDAPKARRLHSFAPSAVRQYSTAQHPSTYDAPKVYTKETAAARRELNELMKLDNPLKLLPHFLRNPPPGKQELAWQIYLAIAPDQIATVDRNWSIRLALLSYLIADDKPTVPNRLLQLFNQIPPEKRQPSSYRAAIVAYISLGLIGPALQIVETIAPTYGSELLHIGLDIILKRVVLDEHWPHCLHIFSLFLRPEVKDAQGTIEHKLRWADHVPEIWGGIGEVPSLEKSFQSLLTYIHENSHEIESSVESKQVLEIFMKNFVPHVIDQIFDQHWANEYYIDVQLRKLFKDLDALNLLYRPAYERAILRSISMPRYRLYIDVNQRRWLDDLYKQYRDRCVAYVEGNKDSAERHPEKMDLWGPIGEFTRPSRTIFRELIKHYDEMAQLNRIEGLLQDLRLFYHRKQMPPGLLKDLIHLYAKHGDVAKVEHYTDELSTYYRAEVNIFVLSARTLAYARRGDVEGTIREFNRLEDHYGLVPDAACWNMLLLAFVRADDLDGAIGCFNKFLDNGIQPDKYTFTTLLTLCATRGDVEAYETLFSKAKELGISLTAHVRARSAYVQTFLNAGDPKGAYALAQDMLRSWKTGRLDNHPLTHTWNLLIQHHALNRDIAGARARYQEMIANNIPVDSWTYGSLMRALIEIGQSNAAYKILNKTMPAMGVRAEALHYAIVITGFLKEGGGQLELAMRAYRELIRREIPRTESSGEATILLLGETELRRFKAETDQPDDDPSESTSSQSAEPGDSQLKSSEPTSDRVKDVETSLENIVLEALQRQSAHQQPIHLRSFDTRRYEVTAQSYYGSLVWLGVKLNTFQIVNKFLEKATELVQGTINYSIPLTLIEAAMRAHLKAGRHSEVAKYWTMARDVAGRLSKTVYQNKYIEEPILGSNGLLDSAIINRYEESKISNRRRHTLAQAAHVYIRSLVHPGHPSTNGIQVAEHTIRELLINGYVIENFTWNEFVTTLANQGKVAHAFKICEAYLMPDFPGWRTPLHANYIRKDQRGYSWTNIRHWELKKTSILPRYKTMVVLATAMRKVRSDEENGRGYDAARGRWLKDIIYLEAPRTVRAIETMPRTHDKLQAIYL